MSPIPFFLDQGAALAFFILSVLLVAAHTAMSADAARRAGLARRSVFRLTAAVALFLSSWLGIALVTNDLLPRLAREVRLPLTVAVGFGPVLVAVALLFSSRSLRAVNDALPPAWLVWAQAYRILGFLFLYPYFTYGVVPAEFALPAGVGDMITAALALPLGRAIARGNPQATRWAVAWNVFGFIDLIVAPASAIASHANVLGSHALAIVPLFLGPPLGILVHVLSLRNLAVSSRGAPERELAFGTN